MKDKAYISRKEQAVLTKKKIFDTTMLLIRKKSYSKITIREICQSAEISIGTFYLYFLSKDDILLDLYRKMEQEFTPESGGPVSPCPLDVSRFPASLLPTVDRFLRHLHRSFEKDLLQEIYRIALSSAETALFSPESPFYQLILSQLMTASDAGRLREDTELSTLIGNIFTFLQGHIFHWLSDDNLDFSCMKASCLAELEKYLFYYLKV